MGIRTKMLNVIFSRLKRVIVKNNRFYKRDLMGNVAKI